MGTPLHVPSTPDAHPHPAAHQNTNDQNKKNFHLPDRQTTHKHYPGKTHYSTPYEAQSEPLPQIFSPHPAQHPTRAPGVPLHCPQTTPAAPDKSPNTEAPHQSICAEPHPARSPSTSAYNPQKPPARGKPPRNNLQQPPDLQLSSHLHRHAPMPSAHSANFQDHNQSTQPQPKLTPFPEASQVAQK